MKTSRFVSASATVVLAILALGKTFGAESRPAGTNAPSGAALLAKAYETISGVNAQHQKSETQIQGMGKEQTMGTEIWFQRPNLLRYSIQSGGNTYTALADGKNIYLLNEKGKKYTKAAQPVGLAETLEKMKVSGPQSAILTNAPILGEIPCRTSNGGETEIDGVKVTRVDLKPLTPGAMAAMPTLLIDDKGLCRGYEIVQGPSMRLRSFAAVSEQDPALDKNLFIFTPQKDWRQVKSLGADEEEAKDEWIGKEAPDFTVKGLDGKETRLSQFRGSPVLLDFWATWCPPCLAALPFVQKAFDLREKQGLKVLAVTDEDKDTVAAFLKKSPYALPMALDEGQKASGLYKIEAVPSTFAIDKQGVIRGHDKGFGGEEGLEELLKTIDVAMDLAGAVAPIPSGPGFAKPLSSSAQKRLDQALVDCVCGRTEKALQTLRALVADEPSAVAPYLPLLALLIDEKTDGKEIEAVAAPALERFSADGAVLNELAYLLADNGICLDTAGKLSARATALMPEEAGVADTAGWVAFKQDKLDEAIKLLEKASTELSEEGIGWYHLARAYEAKGEGAGARLAYKKAVALGGAPADAQSRLDRLTKSAVQGAASEPVKGKP